jgi:hypothetical protein
MPRHAIAAPDQQPDGGVFLLLPFSAPPVGKKQALPSLRKRKKFVYRE